MDKNKSTAAQAHSGPSADKPDTKVLHLPRQPHRRLRDGQSPIGALTWVTHRQRARQLHEWRKGVLLKFARELRAIKIAWVLEYLFQHKGYAYISNPKLADEASIRSIRNVERGLKALADAKAVIIVHVGRQRRIFPAIEIARRAPAVIAGINTGRHGRKTPAVIAGQNKKETFTPLSTTQRAARRDAELRDQRHPNGPSDGVKEGFDDDGDHIKADAHINGERGHPQRTQR